MANGTIHKLGTLYIDDQIIPRSTNPWSNTISVKPSEGNLYHLSNYGYGKYPLIEIKNTSENDSYKIQWIEINDGSDQFLIADRNLCSNIEYEHLQKNGLNKPLGEGKTINIDGGTYELFMLSAGENTSVQTGTVVTNQWDKYIGNCGNFDGLPTPEWQDMQNSSSTYNFVTPHNQMWNWAGCFSWSNYEEEPDNKPIQVSVRGNMGARKWDIYNGRFQDPSLGWRPALKVINTNRYPQIEPTNTALGSFSQPTDIDFTVSDPDGDYFNVTVSIDYVEKESYSTQYGPKTITLELSRYWSELNTGSHTITIDVEDANKNQTIKTYIFSKTNSIPTISPTSQYLGSLTRPKDFNFTIYDADNDKMTLTFTIDREPIETWSEQSNGQKNCSILTSHWSRISLGSHTINITVTDTHGNSASAAYTFDKTNNSAAAPTILSPSYDGRVSSDFYVEFNIGEDPEGDGQTVTIQIANNQYMSSGLQEFSSQIEKYNGSSWEAISAQWLTNSDVGKRLRMHITGVSLGTKYIRIGSLDVGSGRYVYSSVTRVTVGQSYLEVKTHPYTRETMPDKIIVLLSLVAGSQTQKEIMVCNNANEYSPTWETYTPDESGMYTFKNKTQPASGWAVSAKIKVIPNGYTGEISLSAIGLGVL